MVAEGTPSNGSAFGFYEDAEAEDFLGAGLEEAPEAPEVPAPAEEAEVPEEPEPSAAGGPEEPGETPEAPEGEEGSSGPSEEEGQPEGAKEEPTTYADGKFSSVGELEKGYSESVAWNTRLAQQVAQQNQAIADLQRTAQESQAFQAQLVYEMNRQRAEQDPEFAEQWAAQLASQKAFDERIAAEVDPIRQQLEADRAYNDLVAVVEGFRREHPEVTPNSPAEDAVAAVVKELSLDVGDPNALELAFQASQDPALRQVFNMNPALVETSAGIEMAVSLAEKFREPAGQPTPAPQTDQPQAEEPAHVETGPSGAPVAGAPGDRPKNAFSEVMALADAERDKSIFGI